MAGRPETAADFAKLVQLADKISKARKSHDPKFEEVAKEAQAAVDANDTTMIDFYESALGGEINKITALLHEVDMAIIALKDVELDQDFVGEKEAEVEKAAKVVAESRTSLTKQFQTAKRLQNATEKATANVYKNEEQVLRNLAALDREVKDGMKELEALFKKSDAIAVKAVAAAEARNAKALADAKKQYDLLLVDFHLKSVDSRRTRVTEFRKLGDDAELSEALRADVKDGCDDLLRLLKPPVAWVESLAKQEKLVGELAVEEIDVGKAMGALELDKKFEKKLAAILNGPAAQLEAALGKLMKEAKLELTGKEAKEALKKAKVI